MILEKRGEFCELLSVKNEKSFWNWAEICLEHMRVWFIKAWLNDIRNTTITTTTITMQYIIHTSHKKSWYAATDRVIEDIEQAPTTLWEEFNTNSLKAKGFIYSLHRSLNIIHCVLVPSRKESIDWLCENDFKAPYFECK